MIYKIPKDELVFVDMDGVLANFDLKVNNKFKEWCDGGFNKENKSREWFYQNIVIPSEHFYSDLEPINGAIEAYQKLCKKYSVYILSTPSWRQTSSWTDKRIWVEKYLGDYAKKRLILSHNKALFSGKYLIDDNAKRGSNEFDGEFIHFGTERFLNWEMVLDYIL